MNDALVIGVDFGTDSARAILVDALTGDTQAEASAEYPRWRDGLYCRPEANEFRQHPRDYIEALENVVNRALSNAGPGSRRCLRAICIDSTGSTPGPIDKEGKALALLPGFEHDPNAMFYLWKDYTATEEAREINEAAARWGVPDFLRFQGYYSSEWFWAKILHAVRVSPLLRDSAYTWIEECEWLPSILRGKIDVRNVYRSACAAGHKALWHSSFGGLPSRSFFQSIDPYLATIQERYSTVPGTPNLPIGTLCAEWADKWGVSSNVVIAGSQFDAHAGAVGAGIRPGYLVKVIGTSSVDLAVEEARRITKNQTKEYFGQAEDSILPGYMGIEAGQAAFGDVFAWLKRILLWPHRTFGDQAEAAMMESSLLEKLDIFCMRDQFVLPSVLSLDWFNGRRYPFINSHVKAAIMGLGLSTDAVDIYRSLVSGTAFGARRILDCLLASGVIVNGIIAVGGVARKSPFIMQTMASVLNRTIAVSDTDQACAKGSAMYAAVASGVLPSIAEAQERLADGIQKEYRPDPEMARAYSGLFQDYLSLGDFVEKWFDRG